jgi:hypothetical protein
MKGSDMKFYRYWVRAAHIGPLHGRDVSFNAWAASNETEDAARRDAEQRYRDLSMEWRSVIYGKNSANLQQETAR